MPIRPTVATDNFLARHHVFMSRPCSGEFAEDSLTRPASRSTLARAAGRRTDPCAHRVMADPPARRQRLAAAYHPRRSGFRLSGPAFSNQTGRFRLSWACSKAARVSRLPNPRLSQAELGCAPLNEPHNSLSGRRRATTAALLIQGFGQRMWINDQGTVAWRTAAEPE
jgi:hypothetical protein